MNLKLKNLFIPAAMTAFVLTGNVSAADINKDMAAAYDAAVTDKAFQEGFHVIVNESTTSAKTGQRSDKTVEITANGFDNEGKDLKAIIKTTADGQEIVDYYSNGFYYTTANSEKVMIPMTLEEIGAQINMDIYHSLTSDHMSMLYETQNAEGKTEFNYSATDETLGTYKKTLLDALTAKENSDINYLQGTLVVSEDGKIEERTVNMNYSLAADNGINEGFHKVADAKFDMIGDEVKVELPELTGYKEMSKIPQVTVIASNRDLWTTANVNIRAGGSVEDTIIGGAVAGTAVKETGITTEGWSRIDYNGRVAFIKTDYLSTQKPAAAIVQTSTKKTEDKNTSSKKDTTKKKKNSKKSNNKKSNSKKSNTTKKKNSKKSNNTKKKNEKLQVSGKITSVDKKEIVIRTDDGGSLTMKRNDKTTIKGAKKLKVDQKVDCTYKAGKKSGWVAVKVKVK